MSYFKTGKKGDLTYNGILEDNRVQFDVFKGKTKIACVLYNRYFYEKLYQIERDFDFYLLNL